MTKNFNNTTTTIANDVYDEFLDVVSKVQSVVIPIIIFLGMFGNIIAVTVFLSKSFRNISCSILLAARSITDTGFLMSLFVVWLTSLKIRAFHVQGICQIVLFLTYICGFLSVWFVVCLTVENYIRICHPFRACTLCTVRNAKILVTTLSIFAGALYNFPLWTNGVVMLSSGTSSCILIEEFSVISHILVYTDTIITFIIPSVLMVILVVRIACSLVQTFKRKLQMKSNANGKVKRCQTHAKMTKLLYAVSISFLILNLPSHIIRIKLTITAFVYGNMVPGSLERALQTVFQLLYYFNFAVNILIYMIIGDKFRNSLLEKYKPLCGIRGQTRTTQTDQTLTTLADMRGNMIQLTETMKLNPTENDNRVSL